jgi:protein pelota
MKLIRQNIDKKSGSGSATLMPQEPEDMVSSYRTRIDWHPVDDLQWHAYNLIQPNDQLSASAIRRVVTEAALTGSTTSKRVHITLTIRVTKTDFDASSSQLHVSGKVVEANEFVEAGAHHTLDLELHRQFTLAKAEGWDSIALQQLKDAVDTRGRANLWAVIMGDGEANIAYITDHQTVLRQRVSHSVPKKKASSTDHDKAVAKFHSILMETLLRHLELNTASFDKTALKPLLLASPGFSAQNFYDFLKTTAQQGTNKALVALIPMITITHSSSANLASLAEVLKSPAVLNKLQDSRFARETRLMDTFYESVRRDDGKAHYGPTEVQKVVDKGAVGRGGGVLLISDRLFRAQNVGERRRWVELVDKVREEEGGEVRVLSAVHESGKRLEALGGVAAISTYPIFDEDEEDDEEAGEEN